MELPPNDGYAPPDVVAHRRHNGDWWTVRIIDRDSRLGIVDQCEFPRWLVTVAESAVALPPNGETCSCAGDKLKCRGVFDREWEFQNQPETRDSAIVAGVSL